jgi:hypothetical protein
MNTRSRHLSFLAATATAVIIVVLGLVMVARAASSLDFRYGSAQFKGLVSDCVTSATVGLAKAGFEQVSSEVHASNSAVYGEKAGYTGVVLCTKAESGTTYAELVFGPSDGQLDSLFKVLDTEFK